MDKTLNSLTSLMLYSTLAFHVRHFNAPSQAAHTVLQEAYDACDEFADEIGEQYLSLFSGKKVTPNFFPAPGLLKNLEEQTDVVALENLILSVVEAREILAHQGALASITTIVDAHMANLNRVLYRLRLGYGAL